MLKGLIRQIAVVVTTVSVLIMNALANSLPLNGLTTGEISARFPVLFTPAGYVFSIWSVIYIGLIAYTVYQALPAQRDSDLLDTVGWLYVASGVLNIIWLLLWHYLQIALTFPVMALLLVTLIAIYARLGVGIRDVPAAEKWAVHIPFSVYLGWITVATVTNAAVVLYNAGWNGLGISAEIWTAVLIVAATLIALGIAFTRGDAAYVLVPVWAFIGIAAARSGSPLIVTTAYSAAAVLGVIALIALVPRGPLPLIRQRSATGG